MFQKTELEQETNKLQAEKSEGKGEHYRYSENFIVHDFMYM